MSYQYSLELTNKWTKKQIHDDNKLFLRKDQVQQQVRLEMD